MERLQKLYRMLAVLSITSVISISASSFTVKEVPTQKINFALDSTIKQYRLAEGRPYIMKLLPETKKIEVTSEVVPQKVVKTETAPTTTVAANTTPVQKSVSSNTSSSKSTSTAKSTTSSKSTQKKLVVVASRGGSAPVVSTSSAGASNGQKVASNAMKYVGSRYVSGGSSPSGFDCSGFTSYVYSSVGVSISHNAAAQAGEGTSVPASQLKPGDLVFFQTHGSGISHVGIYIGNGQFVHAGNTSTGVTVSSLGASYYASRYRGAKRIFH